MMHQRYFNLTFPEYQKIIVHHHLSQTQQFGLTIERFVQSELIARGHKAELLSDFNASFDILADDDLPVEVKAAKLTRRSNGRCRWQFCMTNKINYLACDFVYILAAVDADGEIYTFVIPSAFVGGRRFIELSSHPKSYGGQWKQYLGAWHWLDTVKAWRKKFKNQLQLELPMGVVQ